MPAYSLFTAGYGERYTLTAIGVVVYANGVYHGRMITVAETGPFQRKIRDLLSEEERSDLIAYLAEHPSAGVLMQGTGGIRKIRWGRQGRGKSGGIRVVYYFHSEVMPLYLLAAFGKNEKANLSKQEKHALSKLVEEIVEVWRHRNE